MSSRLTQVLLALSLLLNCFVLAGFVYRSWVEPPHWQGRMAGGPPPPGRERPSPLDALSQDLKLDDSQKQALKGLFEQYSTTRRDRWHEIQKVREAMSTELQKPGFDMAKIESLVDQMSGLRAVQQKENLRAISELAPKLRPEQLDELHKILADRYGGSGWRPGGPGGPRPPRPTQ
jgi:Spy/CpxP family protein refolding chaperone